MNQQQPSMQVPALIGGAFLGVTSALPVLEYLNCACCGLVVGGGLLASYLYIRDYPPHLPPLQYGDGALLGLFAGAVGWVAYAAVKIPLSIIQAQLGFHESELQQLREALDDPNVPGALRDMLPRLVEGGQFTSAVVVVDLVFFLGTAAVFATLGGILGVALFQNRPPAVPSSPTRIPPDPPSTDYP